MSKQRDDRGLDPLEQDADREARHAHRELVEKLEAKLDIAVAGLQMIVGGKIYTSHDGFSQAYEPEQSRIARYTLKELEKTDE